MLYLLDTGILLRLFNRADQSRRSIRSAVLKLRNDGHKFAVAIQNVAEFWNVSTRPKEARGGLGLSPEETYRHLRVIQRLCSVLPDTAKTYPTWRELVRKHAVRGVQAHDARLVAWMASHRITMIVTLNPSDFGRFSGVVTVNPAAIASGSAK